MDTVTAPDQEALVAQLVQAREELVAIAQKLRAVDEELESLAGERRQHQLLLDVCGSLKKLEDAGGAELFWGEGLASASAEHIVTMRTRIDAFNARIAEIEERRQALVDQVKEQQERTDLFEDELYEAQAEEERRNQEWIVERAISDLPARKLVLPWTRGGEDDRRFRKSLGTALLICLLFVLIVPMIHLPIPAAEDAPKIPERVVRLLNESRPQPPPPPSLREEIKPQPKQQVAEQKPEPQRKPVPEKEATQPQQPAETQEDSAPKGLLAFREKLAGIQDDQVVARLGAQAQINDAADSGRPERSMLTTNAPGSSGGINLAALSRGVGGSGANGNGMARVQVARATSTIGGIGTPGGARPLGDGGPGMSRTDEEIQIVFDRYKAALYRLYNRELRKDPTLRGQMVLRLTIEADGSVSMCELHGSDMNAPELSAQVVERVRTINFGAKEGISAITILYPIDFLPAA
jgi:outer membrane biosynthesis protein TonB